MRDFEYCVPVSVNEAVALLDGQGGRARVLAGGTDLLVQLRAGRFELDRVVDVKRIPALNQVSYDPAAGLFIGAAVPCCRLYEDEALAALYPALTDAAAIIGSIAIQGRATIGGNLCNAAPSGDAIPALIVLGASAAVAGPSGARTIPVEAFCTAPGRTALQPGEVLIGLNLPAPQPQAGASYLRFTPRGEMDIAVASAGASVQLSPDGGAFVSARIALGAVAPAPLLVPEAGAALAGRPVSDESIALAAEAARQAARPITDMRGTVTQRQHLSAVMTRRALEAAVARARGESARG